MRQLRRKKEIKDLFRDFRREHPPRVELSFLLQDWSDGYNVGGLFRVADACGAKEMILAGKTPTPETPTVPVTSMGHHRRISWRHEEDAIAAIESAKADGWTIVAVEVAEDSVCYTDFDWPEKTCLLLGNEQTGIYPHVIKHVDAAVYVPMYGKGRSMNVHVTGAIVAFRAILG